MCLGLMRCLWRWAGVSSDPPAPAPHPHGTAPDPGMPRWCEKAGPAPLAHGSSPPDGLSPDAPARIEQIRETLAAVIYEAFFPTRTWGDATRSGKQTAYAGADAVLHVLNMPQPQTGTRADPLSS